MIEIQEIFRWYRDLPKIPPNLTSIQKEDWNNQHYALFNKSFVGQKLSMCPAAIHDISHDKILASANYNLDYLIYFDGTHYHHEQNTRRKGYAQISYEIMYEKTKFFEQLKSINAHQSVEIEGIITKISWSEGNEFYMSSNSDYYLFIQLSLTSVRKTETRFLHAELLDENLKYQASFKRTMQGFGCFIATVCYGTYNAPEVLVLRQFRDKILLRYFLGKAFVNFYYFVSPFLAFLISKSDFLKKIIRQYILDNIVTIIKRQNNK